MVQQVSTTRHCTNVQCCVVAHVKDHTSEGKLASQSFPDGKIVFDAAQCREHQKQTPLDWNLNNPQTKEFVELESLTRIVPTIILLFIYQLKGNPLYWRIAQQNLQGKVDCTV